MNKKTWRIFSILNGMGTLLFMIQQMEGNAFRVAAGPIGVCLLLPGILPAIGFYRFTPWLSSRNEDVNLLAMALIAVAWNVLVWHVVAFLIRRRMALAGCILLSGAILVVANLVMPSQCSDCHFHRGIPFAYLDEGGFLHDERILWTGALGDFLAVIAGGGILFGVWRILTATWAKVRLSPAS